MVVERDDVDTACADGKPAGVRRAQIATTNGAIFLGAVAVIAVVGYALSTHPYQIPGATAATSTQP